MVLSLTSNEPKNCLYESLTEPDETERRTEGRPALMYTTYVCMCISFQSFTIDVDLHNIRIKERKKMEITIKLTSFGGPGEG